MSEDIPEDIMQTARDLVSEYSLGDTGSFNAGLVRVFARALHTERKKWDGTSVFNRLMEK